MCSEFCREPIKDKCQDPVSSLYVPISSLGSALGQGFS